MKRTATKLALLLAGAVSMTMTGCIAGAFGLTQSTVGGQTLPSAYYLDDDVQYFPAGPEDKLANQRQRVEEYKLQQAGFQEADLDSAF